MNFGTDLTMSVSITIMTMPISQHLGMNLRVFEDGFVNYSNNNAYFTAFGNKSEGVLGQFCQSQQ